MDPVPVIHSESTLIKPVKKSLLGFRFSLFLVRSLSLMMKNFYLIISMNNQLNFVYIGDP